MAIKKYFHNIVLSLKNTNQHFKATQGSQFAAALSYSTLLSVVPLTVLLLFLSLQIELFSTMFEQVREQVLQQILPTNREAVEAYLLDTSKNVQSFSYFSLGTLFLSAIWLSLGIEKAFNHLWSVKTPRQIILRIPTHIIIWLFSPVLIMASISLTTWLTSIPYLNEVSVQVSKLSYLIPWLISSTALFLLYYFVPNTKVEYKAAYLAALLSGLLIEASKWGFSLYITKIALYEKLYGALAALPIFMLWIFISWVIVLWGASLSHTLQSKQGHR